MPEKMNKWDTVLLRGGGFPAFWYNYGYGCAIYNQVSCFVGYSAGALCATILTFPDLAMQNVLDEALRLRSDVRLGHLDYVITKFLDQLLPEDAHTQANGKLGIILCRPCNMMKAEVVSHWSSRRELIACVVASSFCPGLVSCGLVDPVYGSVDGGLSCDLSAFSSSVSFVIDSCPPVNFMAYNPEHDLAK